jgi:hypothetical protein
MMICYYPVVISIDMVTLTAQTPPPYTYETQLNLNRNKESTRGAIK